VVEEVFRTHYYYM